MKAKTFYIVLFAWVCSVFFVANVNAYDVNGDGYANWHDLTLVAEHFEETGRPGWIPEDVNDDGRVNILDAGTIAIQIRKMPTVIDCTARYGPAGFLCLLLDQE